MSPTLLELLKSNYFFLLYFLVLAMALFRYRKYFDSVLKYFPIFMVYTILTEVLAYLIVSFETFQISYSEEYPYANNSVYNLYALFFFFYFYAVFYKAKKAKKNKVRIIYGGIAYAIATLINPFFEDWIIFPQTYALAVGSAALVLSIIAYFIDSRYRVTKNNYLLIWISIGLLIFSLFFPVIMLAAFHYEEFYLEFNLRQVHHVVIVVMYSCFALGFLQMKDEFTYKDT